MLNKMFILISFLLFTNFGFLNAQIGINFGTEYGFGIFSQVGTDAAKIEVGAGMSPLLVIWNLNKISGYGYQSTKTKIKLYFPGIVGAKLNFRLSGEENENRLGMKLGINYNSIIKVGYGGGVSYDMIERKNTIIFSAGVMVYPKADDELLTRLNKEENEFYTQDEVSAFLMKIQPFIGLSIIW